MEVLGCLRKAGCNSGLVLGRLEYLDFFPGIEGFEGREGVPMDLNVSLFEVVVELAAVSPLLAILVAESKRRSRRISSSISFWACRRSLNLSALALFQRENRTSVGGRCWDRFEFGFGFRNGARNGNGMGHFSAILGGTGLANGGN